LPFVCNASPVECAQLSLDRSQICQNTLTSSQLSDPDNLSNFKQGIDDGEEFRGGINVDGSVIVLTNIAADVDSSGFGLQASTQCFENIIFEWNGETFEVDLVQLCPFMDVIRAIILLVSYLIAFKIVQEAF